MRWLRVLFKKLFRKLKFGARIKNWHKTIGWKYPLKNIK